MFENFNEKPEKSEEIDKMLEEFEDQLGLPKNVKVPIPECLNMSLEVLRRKTPDQLGEALYQISQYTFYIRRELDKLKAWSRWGKRKSDELTTQFLLQLQDTSYSWNQKELIARNKPQVCQKLNGFLSKLEMQIERLYNVPNDCKAISDSIRDMKFLAVRREKNND